MKKRLAGRAAVITGANQGLGLAIAKSFACNGADLLLCARDGDRLAAACQALQSEFPDRILLTMAADVSRPEDADALVEKALAAFPHLQILVNNAGIYGPKGAVEEVDWHDWLRAVEINLLGSVLMCRAILPHFKNQNYGKILQLSGGGATSPLPRLSAYAASKAAVVRFAETLAEEVRQFGIDVNSIAPGALNTRMADEVLAAGPELVGHAFYQKTVRQKAEGGTPLERGSSLAVFLASAESDGITGKLLSAVWDPWERLGAHRQTLRDSDIYTLRRIVAEDRGIRLDEISPPEKS